MQTIYTFSDHDQNTCKVSKESADNCRKSCGHKVPNIYSLWSEKLLSSFCEKSDKTNLRIISKQ